MHYKGKEIALSNVLAEESMEPVSPGKKEEEQGGLSGAADWLERFFLGSRSKFRADLPRKHTPPTKILLQLCVGTHQHRVHGPFTKFNQLRYSENFNFNFPSSRSFLPKHFQSWVSPICSTML